MFLLKGCADTIKSTARSGLTVTEHTANTLATLSLRMGATIGTALIVDSVVHDKLPDALSYSYTNNCNSYTDADQCNAHQQVSLPLYGNYAQHIGQLSADQCEEKRVFYSGAQQLIGAALVAGSYPVSRIFSNIGKIARDCGDRLDFNKRLAEKKYQDYTNNESAYEEYMNNKNKYEEYTKNQESYDDYTENKDDYEDYIENRESYDDYTENKDDYEDYIENRESYGEYKENQESYEDYTQNKDKYEDFLRNKEAFELFCSKKAVNRYENYIANKANYEEYLNNYDDFQRYLEESDSDEAEPAPKAPPKKTEAAATAIVNNRPAASKAAPKRIEAAAPAIVNNRPAASKAAPKRIEAAAPAVVNNSAGAPPNLDDNDDTPAKVPTGTQYVTLGLSD